MCAHFYLYFIINSCYHNQSVLYNLIFDTNRSTFLLLNFSEIEMKGKLLCKVCIRHRNYIYIYVVIYLFKPMALLNFTANFQICYGFSILSF